MMMLFNTVTGGDWAIPYKVASASGSLTSTIFVFFVVFFTVGVWNIVASVFIENTMKMACPDREEELLQKHRQDLADTRELMKICAVADTDLNGSMSVDEF